MWEAVLTFLYFPLCVVQAWVADRRLLFYKYVRKRYRADKNRGIIIETEGGADGGLGMDGGGGGGVLGPGGFTKMDMLELDGQIALNCHSGMDGGMMEDGGAKDDEDEARRDMARTLKELKQRHPDKDMEQLIEMANYQVSSTQSHWCLSSGSHDYIRFPPHDYHDSNNFLKPYTKNRFIGI